MQQTRLLARPNTCTLEREVGLRALTRGIRSAMRGKSRTLRVIAILCVLILGLLAALQVAHFHASQSLADHCPLCVSLHSAAPIAAAAAAAILLIQIGRSAPALEMAFVVRRRNERLFTRPPPLSFEGRFPR